MEKKVNNIKGVKVSQSWSKNMSGKVKNWFQNRVIKGILIGSIEMLPIVAIIGLISWIYGKVRFSVDFLVALLHNERLNALPDLVQIALVIGAWCGVALFVYYFGVKLFGSHYNNTRDWVIERTGFFKSVYKTVKEFAEKIFKGMLNAKEDSSLSEGMVVMVKGISEVGFDYGVLMTDKELAFHGTHGVMIISAPTPMSGFVRAIQDHEILVMSDVEYAAIVKLNMSLGATVPESMQVDFGHITESVADIKKRLKNQAPETLEDFLIREPKENAAKLRELAESEDDAGKKAKLSMRADNLERTHRELVAQKQARIELEEEALVERMKQEERARNKARELLAIEDPSKAETA
ncbi:MAG: hypothetical protein HQK84_11415 [Nitrospinae bacterium]|nr:hypothetical protein [Nitrospinota bacterium]